MSAATIALIQLVATYGVPLAKSIYKEIDAAIKDKGAPTDEMWDALAAKVKSAEEIKAEVAAELN